MTNRSQSQGWANTKSLQSQNQAAIIVTVTVPLQLWNIAELIYFTNTIQAPAFVFNFSIIWALIQANESESLF